MADTNETIADIIADMRRWGLAVWASPTDIKRLADRLEAARKRELTKECPKNAPDSGQFGDAAKLREAVVAIIKVGYPHNFQREAPHIRGYCYDITKAIDKCYEALDAPLRNCDVAQDWQLDLYCHFKPPANIKREMPPEWVDAIMAFCRWLVAPATERKGGAR